MGSRTGRTPWPTPCGTARDLDLPLRIGSSECTSNQWTLDYGERAEKRATPARARARKRDRSFAVQPEFVE